ncbi:hypothetical protein [Bradyrhizobium genosp. P]|uniref:hypothetical protein n=1 Tax=Bradyrhizobium genosp. P TaxID=83641 RepID=UPI003CF62363
MEIVQRVRPQTIQRQGTSHDTAIMLGYLAFAIVLMIAIYLDALSSGTAAGDLATMTVFP